MQKQPNLSFPVNKWVHVLNGLSILCIVGSVIFLIIAFRNLPDTIPVHFHAGEADRSGNKALIFIIPAITIVVFISMYLVSKAPHIFNYPITITKENAVRIYPVSQLFMTIINFEIVFLFSCLSIDFVTHNFGTWFFVTLFVVLLCTTVIFALSIIRLK